MVLACRMPRRDPRSRCKAVRMRSWWAAVSLSKCWVRIWGVETRVGHDGPAGPDVAVHHLERVLLESSAVDRGEADGRQKTLGHRDADGLGLAGGEQEDAGRKGDVGRCRKKAAGFAQAGDVIDGHRVIVIQPEMHRMAASLKPAASTMYL